MDEALVWIIVVLQIGVPVPELMIIRPVGKIAVAVVQLLPQNQVVLAITKTVVDVIVGEIMVVEGRHIGRTIVDLPRYFKNDNVIHGIVQDRIGVILVQMSVVSVPG